MVTSWSNNVRTVRRSQWYFGQYQYCTAGILKDCSVLRFKDHGVVESMIARRLEWSRRMPMQPGSWMKSIAPSSDDDMQNLHQMLDWILAQKDTVRTTVCQDQIHLYCHDVTQALQASQLPGLINPTVMQVQIQGQPGQINLKSSSWLYRTYLRRQRVSSAQKSSMTSFLQAQKDIRLGPALANWLEHRDNLRCQDYYFVDNNDTRIQTFMALIADGIIRTTRNINTY